MPRITRTAYSLAEVSAMFGKRREWAYRLKQAGRLKTISGYGGLMVPASEVERILREAKFKDS